MSGRRLTFRRDSDHVRGQSSRYVDSENSAASRTRGQSSRDTTVHGSVTPRRMEHHTRYWKIPSMITGPEGDLIAASEEQLPAAASSKTKRRSASRRKRRQLERMERHEAQKAARALGIVPSRYYNPQMNETSDSSLMTETEPEIELPQPARVDILEEILTGCPICGSDRSRILTDRGGLSTCPDCTVIRVEKFGTFEGHEASLLQARLGHRLDVEPYVPESLPPPPPIPDHIMAKIRKMRRFDKVTSFESIDGRDVNIMEGLKLFLNVFSLKDELKITEVVKELIKKGRRGLLKPKTYSEPRKWKRGKGRITIQCGCCYNFAKDRLGNPPGILPHDEVDEMPPEIKKMVKRMIEWHVLPADCIPNSCIINVYKEGDCIPPHIDNHDFLRPFCTVSFLSESEILFGTKIRIIDDGEFEGTARLSLPVGSVLVLQGNGADLTQHCIPGVRQERISVTFRRMSDEKTPAFFQPDPELESYRPLPWIGSTFG